jgi:hypothetical protein
MLHIFTFALMCDNNSERKAVIARQKEAAKIGVGVDSKTQELFDVFSQM